MSLHFIYRRITQFLLLFYEASVLEIKINHFYVTNQVAKTTVSSKLILQKNFYLQLKDFKNKYFFKISEMMQKTHHFQIENFHFPAFSLPLVDSSEFI